MKLQLIHQKVKPSLPSPSGSVSCSPPTPGLHKIYREAVLVLGVVLVLILLMLIQLLLFPLNQQISKTARTQGAIVRPAEHLSKACTDPCSLTLVESIPEGMHFDPNSTRNPSISDGWMKLLSEAASSVDIASFYWTMRNDDTKTKEPTASQGEAILKELERVSGKLSVRVAVSKPSRSQTLADLTLLQQSGAEVTVVDMPRLTTGVLHTKFWIVDKRHLYIGSANMDWRSLTQVKELGAIVYNCSCLAEDLGKIFEAYWSIGGTNSSIPDPWPSNYSTLYNRENPMELKFNNIPASVYFSSSPPALCPKSRTDDLASILGIIDDAAEFVHVAVMNYIPVVMFSHPRRFWPAIDSHLRRAAFERNLQVRLLVSCWQHTDPSMFPFLHSLAALKSHWKPLDVEVRVFVVPATQKQSKIPYSRVNHNKYMVTDKVAYIGTSNWSGDYFENTAGVGLVINQTDSRGQSPVPTIPQQLQEVFERDWNSPYSKIMDTLNNWHSICKYV
ncbi:5'-3' exonuclease PLD3 [Pristis pectinata]|uniref:5'-3' exonuclease PLD3 n=1 Tax=Pristis pectinata TaxID=685728 RepID=UPI00223D908C|nr:5'-3' exonuclease PLD3 [Pristis pectinata]XP_051900315.1 5'-3' exonuclease PLD3 [Pristis pectinata]